MTISEMADKLGLPPDTIRRRLQRAGIKPFCQEALYTKEHFEAIRNVPGKGRPKKQSLPDMSIEYPPPKPAAFETRECSPLYQPIDVHKANVDNNVAAFVPILYIPFYGKAAAGRPIDIDIPPSRVIPVPATILKGDKSNYFSIEIKGSSMTKAGLLNGDIVVMRRTRDPLHGKVMLVRYGDESTVKRIRIKGRQVLLCWEDGSGEVKEVDSSEYEIQGEFVKILRDLD